MRRSTLLTQVLAVNALLVGVTALIAAVVARDRLPDVTSGDGLLVLGLTVTSAILLNSLLLRARLEPMDRLVRAMTAVDLARPGMRAQTPRRAARELHDLTDAFNRMLTRLEDERRESGRAVLRAQEQERGADRAGPPRRGQPGADGDPAAPLGDDRRRAVGPALRAAGDPGARQPGDGRAARARPPAAPDRARRPRPDRRARLAGLRLRPAHRRAGPLPPHRRRSRSSPTRSSS